MVFSVETQLKVCPWFYSTNLRGKYDNKKKKYSVEVILSPFISIGLHKQFASLVQQDSSRPTN
jgi:hypothetical protein